LGVSIFNECISFSSLIEGFLCRFDPEGEEVVLSDLEEGGEEGGGEEVGEATGVFR